jgi:hypothetical protein
LLGFRLLDIERISGLGHAAPRPWSCYFVLDDSDKLLYKHRPAQFPVEDIRMRDTLPPSTCDATRMGAS